jgi:hypothetical protein
LKPRQLLLKPIRDKDSGKVSGLEKLKNRTSFFPGFAGKPGP